MPTDGEIKELVSRIESNHVVKMGLKFLTSNNFPNGFTSLKNYATYLFINQYGKGDNDVFPMPHHILIAGCDAGLFFLGNRWEIAENDKYSHNANKAGIDAVTEEVTIEFLKLEKLIENKIGDWFSDYTFVLKDLGKNTGTERKLITEK